MLVILFIIVIIVTKVIIALMLEVVIGDRCVLKKWERLRRLCVEIAEVMRRALWL